MARKRRKKGKRKPKPKLTTITDVVAKAVTSRKLMRLWNEALLSDEVKDLRQRLAKAENDREALRKRAAEREDQQEAVFETLKERVVIAQSEIQTLVKRTQENDERRRREHDDTQRNLQERIDEMYLQRLATASLQADLRDKEKTLDRFTSELQQAAIKNEELKREQKRLKNIEQMLDTFRRNFVVLGRTEAGEEIRHAVANAHGIQAGEDGETGGIDVMGEPIRLPPTGDVPGLGLVPLLIEGMAQFPGDVKLTRDALALLGYIASLEQLGRTFLTTHRLYRQVVAALQRHVIDGVVALYAARLLHKSALQGKATALDLRKAGVIPLLAEALATASFGPTGARKPRRLLYHALATIRLCYPSGFFCKSLVALRLQHGCQPNPSQSGNKALLSPTRTAAAAAAAAAAAITTAPCDDVQTVRDRTMSRRNGGRGGGGSDDCGSIKAEGGGEATRLKNASSTLLFRSPPPLHRYSLGVKACTRAPQLRPLPAAARENAYRRPGKLPFSKRSHVGPILVSKQACESKPVGYEIDLAGGNGYWDLLGGNRGRGHDGDDDVLAGELAESAVASVVLLRWAMECIAANDGKGGAEDGDGVVPGTTAPRDGFTTADDDDPAKAPVGKDRTTSTQGEAVSATATGQVRLAHSARKPRDSNRFSFSGSLEERRASHHGEGDCRGPRKAIGNKSFAATCPSLSESSCNRERLRDKKPLPRELPLSGGRRGGGGGGGGVGEEQQPPEGDRGRPAGGIVVTSPSPGDETNKDARHREGWRDGRTPTVAGKGTASGDEPAEDMRTVPKRWLAPAAHEVALHALVCLLRAAEVDLCGHSSTNRLPTELERDTVGGGRAVVMEESVLLLLLKACVKFQDHGDVVKICCMLMRVGVMCALHGAGFERPVGGPIAPDMALLVDNGVEGVVTRAAKAHVDNLSVAMEASALLHSLGMDSIRIDASGATCSALPPAPPTQPAAGKSDLGPASAVVTVDAVTKASTTALDLGVVHNPAAGQASSIIRRTEG
ncbi:unnamed protein product [Ectocarpus sp. 13 AM-2016]